MRYISTKDGRIIDTERYGNLAHNSLGYVTYLGAVIIKEKDINREANTITELCDRFVYVTNKGNHYVKDKHNAMHLFFDDEKPIAYYGAVWTDKGLIYVAQMNSKGELELL